MWVDSWKCGTLKLMSISQRGFAPLFIIIGVILLIFLGLVIQHITGFGLSQKRNNTSSEDYQADGNCQSGEIPKFEAEFTDFEKINAINPIGGVGGGSPGRSYIGVVKGPEAPLFAPTDMVLETIIYAKRPKDPMHSLSDTGKGEYGLYFKLNCDTTLLFDHIDRVSDKILAVAPKEPSESSRTGNSPPVNMEIKKGELLGYTDGTPQARTFDFLIIDRSKPATHINPKRWEWEQAVYSQCPYDYFTLELKEKYYKKIGESVEISGIPAFTPAENCGTLSHDKLGTIFGGWFKGESTDTKGDFLNLATATKPINRVDIAVKKDGSFGPDSVMHDYSPKVSPEDVKVGGEVCYFDSNQNKWAYIKLVSDTKLSFMRGTGSCPATSPQAGSETWER